MASNDVLPRFFSVFLSQYSSESLVIPRSYYEHLPPRLPKTAILMGTGGRFWKVGMMSKQEQVYFEQGWGNFVVDNELKDGEFLTFVFDGHQSYEVSIYCRGGCKKTRAAIEVEEISDDIESDGSLVDITSSISVAAVEVVNTSMTSRQRGYKKTIENPELYLDDPNNICFQTNLKLRKFELLVHAKLVRDYCLKFSNKVDYIDGYGKLTAKTTKWADQRVCIKKWHKICNRNKVTENDSILCEVFRNNDKVVHAIKIHIIRDGVVART